MKKFFTILALAMASVWSLAKVNISVAPNVIDFGTVNLDANGEYTSDWEQAILSWSGLIPYCSVYVDTVDAPAATAGVEFYISSDDDSDYWYGGDEWNPATNPNVWVAFYGSISRSLKKARLTASLTILLCVISAPITLHWLKRAAREKMCWFTTQNQFQKPKLR